MTDKQTFPIEFTKDQLRDLIRLLEFCQSHHPFIPDSIGGLSRDCYHILNYGCWKHKVMFTKFKTGINSTEYACQKCDPKKYQELVMMEMRNPKVECD